MFCILRTFLKNREAFIELHDFRSSVFKIDIGVPQGSVLSPLLFVIFLNVFLSEEPCHYKFADDSAILIQACNENDISQKLEQSCRGIEQWCRKWRMGVNGSKTELIVFNVERNNITAPSLNSEACAITKATKSLGLLIDDNLCYKDHAEKICNKAKRS